MPDFDNTPAESKDLSAPFSDVAPGSRDLSAAQPDVAPDGIALGLSQDNTPAVEKTLAQFAQNDTPPDGVDLTTPTTPNNAPAVPIGEPPASLLNMPSTFTPAFVELAAGGNSLNTLNASAADIGKVVQGTVGGQLKSYQVRAGTDAQDLPGIVRPANYDGVTNAVVFVQS